MTADVIAMRREADRIGRRHTDVIGMPVATTSSQLAQVERQQALASLIAAVGDGRLSIDDDQDLPLVVDVLLRNCPQSRTSPATVAKTLEEAGDAYRKSLIETVLGEDPLCRSDYASEAAFICSTLAAGTAMTSTYGYAMSDCQMLSDWLLAAATR